MCGGTNDRATLTSDAGVGSLEVRHQFLGARVIGVQRGVRHGQLAATSAGTAAVEMGRHVGRTADRAVDQIHKRRSLQTRLVSRPNISVLVSVSASRFGLDLSPGHEAKHFGSVSKPEFGLYFGVRAKISVSVGLQAEISVSVSVSVSV